MGNHIDWNRRAGGDLVYQAVSRLSERAGLISGRFIAEGAMDIYKNILHTIIEPILHHDEERLNQAVVHLKQTDGESWAVGEMLERALRYITLTVQLAKEQDTGDA